MKAMETQAEAHKGKALEMYSKVQLKSQQIAKLQYDLKQVRLQLLE